MLLFDPDHPLNKIDAPFVFSTEGHPLILPRRGRKRSLHSATPKDKSPDREVENAATCPAPAPSLPFTMSATAARIDIFHAANLARLHLMPQPETIESPLVEYSSDHPSISISDVRSPSNYTYYPWTLPPELVPWDAISTIIASRPAFDITFPSTPNTVLSPGMLQRVVNGILINSMSGIRFGMIQDAPVSSGDGGMFRVQAINNILLGKDEKVFLPREVISDIVSPQDPNFERIRDTSILDLVIDAASPTPNPEPTNDSSTNPRPSSTTSPQMVPATNLPTDAEPSPLLLALSSLVAQLHLLLPTPNSYSSIATASPFPSSSSSLLTRHYIPAILPTGLGAAPLPDIEEALGPDIAGNPQGTLLYSSVYVGDTNCDRPLPASVVKNHQILVLRRGVCSFSQKLQNVPAYPPSRLGLQLVVVVSSGEDDEELLEDSGSGYLKGKVGEQYLIRPLLDATQMTPKGLPRRYPIPMVMIGGGEETMALFRGAVAVGVKRRWRVRARGIEVGNLIIT